MRTAPAAYWGAWADSFGYLGSRCPNLARACSDALARGGVGRAAMCAAQTAANLLRSDCCLGCPTDNVPAPGEAGPGDWPHGWQFHASRTRTNYFRERVLLPTLEPAHRALLLSQSGQQAAAWLTAVPADTATTLPSRCAASRDAHELVRQLVRVRALRAPPAVHLCLGCLGPRVVGHAVGSGPARDRRGSAGRTAAVGQTGSSFGAGGADRPQPPANALSMVLTVRSTARCSGHKLFLGVKNFSAKDVAKVNEHLTFSS